MMASVARTINQSVCKGLAKLRTAEGREAYDKELVRRAILKMFELGNPEIHSKALGVELGIAGIQAKKGKPSEFGNYVGTVHENRMYDALKALNGKAVYKPTTGKATWKLRPNTVKALTEQANEQATA